MRKTVASQLASIIKTNTGFTVNQQQFGLLGTVTRQFGEDVAREAVRAFIERKIPKGDMNRYIYGAAKKISLRKPIENDGLLDGDAFSTELKDL